MEMLEKLFSLFDKKDTTIPYEQKKEMLIKVGFIFCCILIVFATGRG